MRDSATTTETMLQRTIRDLQTLRAMPELTAAAHAKVVDAIVALREAEEAQRKEWCR